MNPEKDLFSEKELSTFTILEFEIYNYIRHNSNKIPYMTIRELSEEAHVSSTTIVNFCKKLGCNGFSEFKVIYKLWRKNKNDAIIEPLNSSLESFRERAATKEFNDLLDEVSEVIHKAKNLIMIGLGNSAIMAKYASNYFSILGKFCSCIENPFFDSKTVDLDECVLMLFSISGEVKNLLPLFDISKNSRMTVVSITNNSTNTIAKLSHYNIAYFVPYDTLPGSMGHMDYTSQVPVIYIIESLAKKAYGLSHQDL